MIQRRKFWMRWRVRAGYPTAVAYWLIARPSVRSILIGAIVAAAGLLIRGAASGHLRKDQQLAASGPYAFTRNPLYFGSAILAAGFVVASNSWEAGALVAIYFVVFYYAVMRNEEEHLRERFGAEFDAYAMRVPLFLPRLGRASGDASSSRAPGAIFSWAQYRRNREYQALAGSILAFGTVWLRMWLRAHLGY